MWYQLFSSIFCVLISDWAHLFLRATLPNVTALKTHSQAVPRKIRTEFCVAMAFKGSVKT